MEPLRIIEVFQDWLKNQPEMFEDVKARQSIPYGIAFVDFTGRHRDEIFLAAMGITTWCEQQGLFPCLRSAAGTYREVA